MVGLSLYFLPTGGTIQQTMTNSPGGIQAGRDVVVASDKRLIHSLSIRVFIDTDTPAAESSHVETDVGLGSIIALFTRDKSRFRFKSDFTLRDQQVSKTRRQIGFVYTPEIPAQILGKEVDFLGNVEVLAVNYSDIFRTIGLKTKDKNARLQCAILLNGVEVGNFDVGENPPGTLDAGQANLVVAEAFSRIPATYKNIVSALH